MKRKIAYFCFATCLLTAGIFASLGNPASAKAEEQDSTQKEASSETGDSAQLKITFRRFRIYCTARKFFMNLIQSNPLPKENL